MRYTRFEELPVWNRAIELAVAVYDFTSCSKFRHRYSLRDQLERAAVSVSNNIAEGFERGTTQELLTFLYIARGSAGEVRSMLCLLERLPIFTDLKSEISNLRSHYSTRS
jgi:four helix bundle protein